jgi:hypothetical protein
MMDYNSSLIIKMRGNKLLAPPKSVHLAVIIINVGPCSTIDPT